MNISVTGPREVTGNVDQLVHNWVDSLPLDTHLFHGNAKGVDRMARDWARKKGLKVTAIEPSYSQYGRMAPLVRNAQIVSSGEEIMGFWHGRPEGGTLCTLWMFQVLKGRKPDWTLIDPGVSCISAIDTFLNVCERPASHWVEALNTWKSQNRSAVEA